MNIVHAGLLIDEVRITPQRDMSILIKANKITDIKPYRITLIPSDKIWIDASKKCDVLCGRLSYPCTY